MRWLRACVARHQIAIYRALEGVPGIPRRLGTVGPSGFFHAYIPGRDLRSAPPLTIEFFDLPQRLLSDMHQRRMAWVDRNKPDTIIVGHDDRPWLIDSQTSFHARAGPLARWMYHRFARADWYRFYKHKTNLLRKARGPGDFAHHPRRRCR